MKQPQAPCKGCDESGRPHKRCELYLQYKKDLLDWKLLCDRERMVDTYQKGSISRRGREYRKNLHLK